MYARVSPLQDFRVLNVQNLQNGQMRTIWSPSWVRVIDISVSFINPLFFENFAILADQNRC